MPEKARPPSADAPAPTADQLLFEDAVSAILNVSTSWLAKARMRGEGPPFIKVGRSIRYFPLGPWLAAQRRPKHCHGLGGAAEPNQGACELVVRSRVT